MLGIFNLNCQRTISSSSLILHADENSVKCSRRMFLSAVAENAEKKTGRGLVVWWREPYGLSLNTKASPEPPPKAAWKPFAVGRSCDSVRPVT